MVAAAIPEHARGKPLELWWQDEARIGQQGTLTRVWAERGSRPVAPRDQRYAWAYLFGAVCPERGIGVGLVLPFVNTDTMNLHLTEISWTITPGAHCLLTLDGAGWHQIGGNLVLPDNITILHLPPYSPELNPQENVRHGTAGYDVLIAPRLGHEALRVLARWMASRHGRSEADRDQVAGGAARASPPPGCADRPAGPPTPCNDGTGGVR